jgi:hypothetical protein
MPTKIIQFSETCFSGIRSCPQAGKAVQMTENDDISKLSADLTGQINSESPSRWVIHCICCEQPVEPWQTTCYQFGYCAQCFGILMEPAGKS